MFEHLLSELFPNFVKKSQLERLAKGPFGEGLREEELNKARVYLKPGEQAPEGANVQTGPQGGQYYDEMGGASSQQVIDDARAGRTGSDIDYDESGGGGAGAGEGQPFPAEAYDQAMDAEVDAQGDQPTYESVPEDMADRQQAAIDEMQQINQQRMAEYQDAQAAGPEALAEWEAGDAQRKEGEAAARADIEGLREARAQGPEAEAAYKDKRKQEESAKYQELVAQVQADLPNKVIEDGPLKGMTYGEADKQLKEFADKVDMEVGANREKVDKLTEILSGQTKEERQEGIDAAMADIEARRAQNESESAGQPPPPDASPPDVSEPTFDGQGNIQTPGSDPYPISELTGSDKETVNALGEQYQQAGGSNPSELLSGYDGPLTEDGIAQYLSDKVQYEDAFVSDNDYYNATDFASWVGEKAGLSETQKMVKMMQKYNVDNKRRDSILLSNKGGRQR